MFFYFSPRDLAEGLTSHGCRPWLAVLQSQEFIDQASRAKRSCSNKSITLFLQPVRLAACSSGSFPHAGRTCLSSGEVEDARPSDQKVDSTAATIKHKILCNFVAIKDFFLHVCLGWKTKTLFSCSALRRLWSKKRCSSHPVQSVSTVLFFCFFAPSLTQMQHSIPANVKKSCSDSLIC